MRNRSNRAQLDEQLRAILAALTRIESQLGGQTAADGARRIVLSPIPISDGPIVKPEPEPEPEPEPDTGGIEPSEGPVVQMIDLLIEDLRTINKVPKTTDEALASAKRLAENVERKAKAARKAIAAVRKTREILPCIRLLCKICKVVPQLSAPLGAIDILFSKLQTLLDKVVPKPTDDIDAACDDIIDALDSLESDIDNARLELAPTKVFFQDQVDEFIDLARTAGVLSSSLESCVTHLHEVVDPVAGVISDWQLSKRIEGLNTALETIDSTLDSFNLAFGLFIQLHAQLDLLHGWLAPIAGWLKVIDDLVDAVAGFIFDIIDGLVAEIPLPFFDELTALINDAIAKVNAWLETLPNFDLELTLPELIPEELRQKIAEAKAEIERLRATAECYWP